MSSEPGTAGPGTAGPGVAGPGAATPSSRLSVPAATQRAIRDLHGRATRRALLLLPSGEPRDHLYGLLPAYLLRRGRGVRPALCMAACAALGGRYEDTLDFAAAFELLHSAFLIHDDIEDETATRRGGPALHVSAGLGLALNAGDALATLAAGAAARAASRFRPPVARALLEGWERMVRETVEGQALDLGWERDRREDLGLDDYLELCGKKTAWYTTVQPLATGAVIASGDPERARDTFAFGWLLGIVFQLANDLCGLDAPGRPGDLTEGKRTLLTIRLLGAAGEADAVEVRRILGLSRQERSAAEIDWLVGQLHATGALARTRRDLHALADETARLGTETFGDLPPSEARDVLLAMPAYVLEGVPTDTTPDA